MPASSRKRNKGKERKAKKEENERAKIHELWLRDLSGGEWGISCDHKSMTHLDTFLNMPVEMRGRQPVSRFMDTFYTHWVGGLGKTPTIITPADMLRRTMQTHPEVCNNEFYRNLIINIMIRIGTNILLYDKAGSLCIAQTITALEHYCGEGSSISATLYNRDTAIKRNNLQPTLFSSGSRRDCLKFFRKRTTCKCLKRLHLEARKEFPKVGRCINCDVVKERASLSVCSRCMIEQYCSKECQVAAWPFHMGNCHMYARAQSEMMNRIKQKGTDVM